MSPEQAVGRPVDKRTDIWSFGVVFYEMLTARRPLHDESLAGTIAAILTKEPDWTGVPMPARRLLERCLDKDPRKRLRDIGDAPLMLTDGAIAAGSTVGSPASRRGAMVPWIAAAALAVIVVALAAALWAPWRAASLPAAGLMRFAVDASRGEGVSPSPALSRDGTRVVYRTQSTAGGTAVILATRRLNDARETVLSGTDGALNPFFSPDGAWIAYFAGSKLWKVPATGGIPIALCDAPTGRGADWGEDGTIVADLSPFSGLWRVSDQGGVLQRLTRPSLERHSWPQFLPGGKAILYSAAPEGLFENGRIEALRLDGGEATIVLRGGYQARYLPTGPATGHLVYVHAGALYAVPFDPVRLEVLGKPVLVLDDITTTGTQGGTAFAFSRTGTFGYVSGHATQKWPLAWLARAGDVQPLAIAPGAYYTPRVSPDGNQIALSVEGDRGQDIAVYDIRRDTTTRLTFTGEGNLWPYWMPDGAHIVFTSRNAEGGHLWWMRTDGAGQPIQLLSRRNSMRQIGISSDGRHVGYTEQDPETGSDLWSLPLDLSDPAAPRPGTPEAERKTTMNEGVPAFSPDGRWVAYITDELGPWGIWVQPFPGGKSRWQVSPGGAATPILWSRKASELLWQGWILPYTVDGERFVPGKAARWILPRTHPSAPGVEMMDLAPDGRMLIQPEVDPAPAGESGRVTFLVNFFDELRRLAPATK